jgi:hypothetical protein
MNNNQINPNMYGNMPQMQYGNYPNQNMNEQNFQNVQGFPNVPNNPEQGGMNLNNSNQQK